MTRARLEGKLVPRIHMILNGSGQLWLAKEAVLVAKLLILPRALE